MKQKSKSKVKPGDRFLGDQRMEVVRECETMLENWWCKGLDDEVGLWVYSSYYILKNKIDNHMDEKQAIIEEGGVQIEVDLYEIFQEQFGHLGLTVDSFSPVSNMNKGQLSFWVEVKED